MLFSMLTLVHPCPHLQLLLVVAALALCVALSMFVADKYLSNTATALESNSSDEDNIECTPPLSPQLSTRAS